MSALFLRRSLRFLYPPWERRAETRGEASTTRPPNNPSFQFPPGPTIFSKAIQDECQSYYDLAQRTRGHLPQNCTLLGSGDVQIIDTTPFSSGGFSDVWKGSSKGRLVVVKSFRCYSSPKVDPAEIGYRFLKTAWVSNQLSHPNVVPFIGVYSTPSHPFALLYEMMGNLDLGQYLADRPDASRLKLLIGIARALKHMHSLNITHGNVKMRNVLVDDDGVARLGGLGSVFPLSFPASWSDVGAEKLFCGTAPELINPGAFGLVQARTTKATDMFAFGLLAWEVFAGMPPFSGMIEASVIYSIFKNDRPLRPRHHGVSDRVWAMIQRCWVRDPLQRMTAAEVVDLLEVEAASHTSNRSL